MTDNREFLGDALAKTQYCVETSRALIAESQVLIKVSRARLAACYRQIAPKREPAPQGDHSMSADEPVSLHSPMLPTE